MVSPLSDGAVAVIQARMSSTRLPGKVLRPLAGRSTLGWVVRAARAATPEIHRVIVATSVDLSDDPVSDAALGLGVDVARGPLEDVLGRFVEALDGTGDDTPVVRLTADCPLLDPVLISGAVAAFRRLEVDYLSTIAPRSLPRGLDVEVTTAGVLREIDRVAEGADRAHVTSHIYRSGDWRLAGLTFSPAASDLRVTLDTEADAAALDAIVAELGDAPPAWTDVVSLLRSRPDLVALNAGVRQKPIDAG